MLGEHLDDLALDERRVDVHHDQPHAAAQQVGRLDGDVDAPARRPPRRASARSRSRVGAGDVQLDRGDRVARHPLDAVDVGAGVGDPAGDRGDGRGPQRRARARSRGCGPRARRGCRRCRGRPRPACPRSAATRSHRGAQRLPVARHRRPARRAPAGARSTICSMSSTSTPNAARRREHGRGDAGPVLAGQRDQEGLRASSSMSRAEAIGPRRPTSRRPPERVSQRGRAVPAPAAGRRPPAPVTAPPSSSRASSTIVAAPGRQRRQAYGARRHRRRGTPRSACAAQGHQLVGDLGTPAGHVEVGEHVRRYAPAPGAARWSASDGSGSWRGETAWWQVH